MKKTSLIFIGLGVAILVFLFVALKPSSSGQTADTSTPPQAFAFTIRGGKKTAGPALIEVVQGAELQLVINADQDDELHVHGYDLSQDLPAGETVSLAFTADRSGRFGIELHGAHAELTALQVQPR